MSWTDSLNSITNAAADIYTANRTTAAAQKTAAANASAANANASATILSSRNMIIAAVVLAVGIGAFAFLRRK